ncbi:kinesin family protein [Chrysochromulina tobinii]|uniref:Kinesin-like protein n=1 Tax=Chrysochromulina tobinii TaxID=1460289 RepID=A0A0M0K6P8_9EUKA|nr:kinesin family protein [Chrysochromulina tobinii]|eukprot:KOO34475.1 kinesin family protein [Chrysochromulina sp. CCMP291]
MNAFSFDGVFGPETPQAEVFARAVEPQVSACLQGFNSTVFCYGPSGTGKSYTCYGPSGAVGSGGDADAAKWAASAGAGMIPRATEHLFAAIERGGALQHERFLLRVSFLQLYRESLSDLLAPVGGAALALREDPHRGVFVEGLTEVAVRTPQQVWALAARGQRARSTAATKANDASSRSHAIFTVIVEQTVVTASSAGDALDPAAVAAAAPAAATPAGGSNSTVGTAAAALKLSRLNLVDLAGSERAAMMGENADRLEESKKINLSLSALAKVISTLVDARGRAVHVPYRDSKLTRLLQDSLGGNCRTAMIACVSPLGAVAEDTMTTLHFASRAKTIQNHARVNLQSNDNAVSSSLLAQYEAQLAQLREQLAQAESARVTDATPGVEAERLESERCAAEAALAQCVREYAKERAQKVRLQQQISALQKRLLRTQIDELQGKVLIGGRPLDEDSSAAAETPSEAPSSAARVADAASAPDHPSLSDTQTALAAERRRADKLEGRVRALAARVQELTHELEVCRTALAKASGVKENGQENGAASAADEGSHKPKPSGAGPGCGESAEAGTAPALDAKQSADVARLRRERDASAQAAKEHERRANRLAQELAALQEANTKQKEQLMSETRTALRNAQKEADKTARRVVALSAEHEKALATLATERDVHAVRMAELEATCGRLVKQANSRAEEAAAAADEVRRSMEQQKAAHSTLLADVEERAAAHMQAGAERLAMQMESAQVHHAKRVAELEERLGAVQRRAEEVEEAFEADRSRHEHELSEAQAAVRDERARAEESLRQARTQTAAAEAAAIAASTEAEEAVKVAQVELQTAKKRAKDAEDAAAKATADARSIVEAVRAEGAATKAAVAQDGGMP